MGLKNIHETGKPLNAEVTPELLATLFAKNAPLHDGAAIIQGNRIVAAACVLPLLQNPAIEERQFGMRHRAGIGIAAESDAVAIIVSEETQEISIACGNQFEKNIPPSGLRGKIHYFLDQ